MRWNYLVGVKQADKITFLVEDVLSTINLIYIDSDIRRATITKDEYEMVRSVSIIKDKFFRYRYAFSGTALHKEQMFFTIY